MPRRRLALWLVPIPFLFVVGVAWRLNQWGKHDRAQRADAIVIFGARVNARGEASPILRARTRHAFELWEKGMASVIVCTGGVGNCPPAEARVSQQLLEGWGVPNKAIRVDDQSTSTWENARNAAALLPPHAAIISVSESFHLWRCRRDCAVFGLTAHTSPEVAAWNPMPAPTRAYYCLREAALVLRDLFLTPFS